MSNPDSGFEVTVKLHPFRRVGLQDEAVEDVDVILAKNDSMDPQDEARLGGNFGDF